MLAKDTNALMLGQSEGFETILFLKKGQRERDFFFFFFCVGMGSFIELIF